MSLPQSCCQACPDTELVEIPGIAGADGADGADGAAGVNAYSTITLAATSPAAVGASVVVTVNDSSWMLVGQPVFVQGIGTFRVTARDVAAKTATLYLLEYPGNVVYSAAMLGLGVSPSGEGVTSLVGTTSPEGATTAIPGSTYLNTTDDSFWMKRTGVGNTGWLQLIACILFLLSLLSLSAAPPILRQNYTTNTQATVAVLVTNAALVTMTNSYSYLSNLSATISLTNAIVRASITNAANSAIAADVTKQPASANLTNWSARPQGLSCMIFAVDDLAITNQLWFTNGVLYATNRYSF